MTHAPQFSKSNSVKTSQKPVHNKTDYQIRNANRVLFLNFKVCYRLFIDTESLSISLCVTLLRQHRRLRWKGDGKCRDAEFFECPL
jgi:hypothetical protein